MKTGGSNSTIHALFHISKSKKNMSQKVDALEENILSCQKQMAVLEQKVNEYEGKIVALERENRILTEKLSVEHQRIEGKADREKTEELIRRNKAATDKYISNTKVELYKEIRYEFIRGLSPDKYREALCQWYYTATRERLDLDNPKTINEKIQWIKLYDSTPLKTQLSDKYEVRNWVKEKIGEEHLIPLLGVWDRFEDIDFNTLPDQFVLKANHGCGWNIIVRDKQNFDVEDARKKFCLWLGKNYAYQGFEFHYKKIVPKIIAEQYMEFDGQLKDYKFLCTNGSIRYIWVDIDRYGDHRRTVFNTEWEEQDFSIAYPRAENSIPKPDNFEKMKELATVLCQGFVLVRVDLYNVQGKIYFGEMTFTPGNGKMNYDPPEFDEILGDMIKLPDVKILYQD